MSELRRDWQDVVLAHAPPAAFLAPFRTAKQMYYCGRVCVCVCVCVCMCVCVCACVCVCIRIYMYYIHTSTLSAHCSSAASVFVLLY